MDFRCKLETEIIIGINYTRALKWRWNLFENQIGSERFFKRKNIVFDELNLDNRCPTEKKKKHTT